MPEVGVNKPALATSSGAAVSRTLNHAVLAGAVGCRLRKFAKSRLEKKKRNDRGPLVCGAAGADFDAHNNFALSETWLGIDELV